MKCIKMFLKFIILFVTPLLFSASVVVGSSEIIAELKSNSDMSSYDLGFSASPVTQWSTKATPVGDKISLAPIMEPTTGKFYATFDEKKRDDLYVYWRLYSLDTVTFSLAIEGPMVNSLNPQDTLHWNVDWNDPGSNVSPKLNSDTKKGPEVVHVCVPLLTLQGVAGSKELSVYTDNLLDKSTEGVYSANLVLTVAVN